MILPFILDTGATELVIPADVALRLVREGALSDDDFLGEEHYSIANGSKQVAERVIIRKVQVGDHTMNDVTALVSPPEGEPLLGESFLSRFGKFTVDTNRLILTLTGPTGYGALAPEQASGGSYGALAWDKDTGRYGWSRNQTTAETAGELAISGCGATGCKIVIRLTSAAPCGALATTEDGRTAGGAARMSDADARLAALANCQKADNGECIIRISECGR